MQVSNRIREIENAALQCVFVQQIDRVDETYYSVKYRLHIAPELFVHLYFNERSGTVGMVLVHRRQRIYGRDCEAGRWHRHPVDDPSLHDTSPEGVRSVSVEEFLDEVQDILVKANLI
ncbi:MAG: hypothetical protein MAG431_00980 [Chloroflexi bacterium]|nr:hypothetical protein [Chloroflexota bacterium]